MVNHLTVKTNWEHLTHRGTNRTSVPRIKSEKYLDRVRRKSRAPGKKGEEIPRGKRQRVSK